MSHSPLNRNVDARRGIVGVVVQSQRLLVIRRSTHVTAPHWLCFPGGEQEHHETEMSAVVRELDEELSLPVRPLASLWRNAPYAGLELAWWQVTILGEATPVPAPMEVAEYFWMHPDELQEQPQLLPSNLEFLKAWRRGEFTLHGLPLDG